MVKETTLQDLIEIPRYAPGNRIAVIVRDDLAVRETKPHRHLWGQLFSTSRGLVAVGAGDMHWLVPAGNAVWIPPLFPHCLRSYGALNSWSLYVDEQTSATLPIIPQPLQTTRLLHEAALRAASWPPGELNTVQLRLADVIIDEVRALKCRPPGLPMPSDPRAARVAHALLANLADNRRIEAWAAWAGASPRTLSRHFITETGLAFGQWRQHARITKALEMLQLDQPITSIALELGYETTSAFISMFKRTWGVTPGKYGSAT